LKVENHQLFGSSRRCDDLLTKKAYLAVVAAALLFIGAVLGFTAWLNVLSFQQNYTDSLVRSYALAGKGIAGKIEYALKYGKPFDNFYGMRDWLAEVNQCLPAVVNVLAVLPDGKIVADLHGPVAGRRMDRELLKKLAVSKNRSVTDYRSQAAGNRQHVMIPVGIKGKLAGSIDIIFAKRVIRVTVGRFVIQLLKYLIYLSLGATILFIGLFRLWVIGGQGEIRPKRLQITLVTVLTLAQIIYGYLNYALFKTGYQDITRDNAVLTAKIIRSDIEAVIAKGVTYDGLYQLDSYFNRIVASFPEIAAIRLTEARGRVRAASTDISEGDWRQATAQFVFAKRLRQDAKGETGKLNVLLSRANLNRKVRDILLDTATVLAVSFFLMLELTLLLMMVLRLQLNRSPESSRENLWECGGIRPLAFITYQAMFLTAAFVPVMMKTFRSPLAGVPNDLALGLPVSVEMLCGLLATVAAGYWTDRKGWRTTFAAGLFVFILGTVFSGIAAGPLLFIAARGLAGSGTGLLVIAMRSCVISQAAATDGNAGIAAMTAGATSGINCGVVGGALLADRIGFAGVFYIAGGISLLALPFLLQKPAGRRQTAAGANEVQRSFGKFILNRQVLCFLGLTLIPLAVCAMFLNYYFPLFASRIGMSSSDTGRAFLLNGLCPILLGPALCKFAGRKLGAGRTMILGAVLTAGALLLFAAHGSLAAALAAIVTLGVAESFGTAAQVEYFMNLAAVREYGQGKALSYFSLAGKLGNMLGPLAFGGVACLGLAAGTGVIGGVTFLAIGLFAAAAGNSLRKQAPHEFD
jgi:predicted MFS family arabinose efflux permease